MFIPQTGSRLPIISKGCPRQELHSEIDLELDSPMSIVDHRLNLGYTLLLQQK